MESHHFPKEEIGHMKCIIYLMTRLEEQLTRLGGGLETIKADTMSVQAKMVALSKEKGKSVTSIHENEGSRVGSLNGPSIEPHSLHQSEMSERPRREMRREGEPCKERRQRCKVIFGLGNEG
ncbi:hypothetical protein CR513_09633, partial [Mucuna pruriens]